MKNFYHEKDEKKLLIPNWSKATSTTNRTNGSKQVKVLPIL
jgi:hypothetical protein